MVDTGCNFQVAGNVAPCVRALSPVMEDPLKSLVNSPVTDKHLLTGGSLLTSLPALFPGDFVNWLPLNLLFFAPYRTLL